MAPPLTISSSRLRLFGLVVLTLFFFQAQLVNLVYENEELNVDHHMQMPRASLTREKISHRPQRSQPKQQAKNGRELLPQDGDCIFKDSEIYRSVYVYPGPGDDDWKGDILSPHGAARTSPWPWDDIDERAKRDRLYHYNIQAQAVQYTTELLVRSILTHPNSCLRTYDPEQASLFFIPYLPSTEYHNATNGLGNYQTSPYGQAIMDVVEKGNYSEWEEKFGLTSKYLQRRNGADHILVMSEPCHGLWHPPSRRGNFHYIHTQKQLSPLIVISIELSKTFIETYPNCASTNIVAPYPNSNGQWFNGKLEKESMNLFKRYNMIDPRRSAAALSADAELASRPGATSTWPQPRPLSHAFNAGLHGTCKDIRAAMKKDFGCTASGIAQQRITKDYVHTYRQATFCPCPGGDTPSAKRMFDAILAGCIPVILSHDFVWPYTIESDPSSYALDPATFSVRLNATDFLHLKTERASCDFKSNATAASSLQSILESYSLDDLIRFRDGVRRAASLYGYFLPRNDLPDNPLAESILPDGGAARALVDALARRANGVRWPACQAELRRRPKPADATQFKC